MPPCNGELKMDAIDDIERNFTMKRKAQGFRSQADLTAFLTYHDHTTSCTECQKPGKAVPFDDGYQPTANRCDEANALWKEWCRIHDNAAHDEVSS